MGNKLGSRREVTVETVISFLLPPIGYLLLLSCDEYSGRGGDRKREIENGLKPGSYIWGFILFMFMLGKCHAFG